MPTFLQAVDVPERCFLHEALLWVAFQRLPIALYNDENKEIREATENQDYEIDSPQGPLTEEECKRAGIPTDPHFIHLMDDSPSPVFRYRELEEKCGHEEAIRVIEEARHKEDEEYKRACTEWQRHYDRAVEYPASQIFVALRKGQLHASGRLLPSVVYDQAMASLKAEGRWAGELPLKEIPSSFWTLKGIHFESSSAQNDNEHYCHILVPSTDLLAAFPTEKQEVIVERIGDTFVLNESARNRPRASRGRPSYPWDRFHLEVAAVLLRNEFPGKKEALIQHFQSWFERELNIRPSRAAISEKLTPYYEKFVRGGGQKI